MKNCDWCGKRVSKPWQKNPKYKHVFCDGKCYQKWRVKNYSPIGQKQDKTAYHKILRLADELKRRKLKK